MNNIQQIIDWYFSNPNAFWALDYKTDYHTLGNIIGPTNLRKLINNIQRPPTPRKIDYNFEQPTIQKLPIRPTSKPIKPPKPLKTRQVKPKPIKKIEKIPPALPTPNISEPTNISIPEIPIKIPFKKYRQKVYILTRKQPLYQLDKYQLWCKYKPKHKKDLRSPFCYCIDHKISIYFAWKNDIPIEDISHLDNLRIVTALDNSIKNTSNLIDDKNQWIWNQFIINKNAKI
jgi:hypothetical protein